MCLFLRALSLRPAGTVLRVIIRSFVRSGVLICIGSPSAAHIGTMPLFTAFIALFGQEPAVGLDMSVLLTILAAFGLLTS
jgi:hypothetical protein